MILPKKAIFLQIVSIVVLVLTFSFIDTPDNWEPFWATDIRWLLAGLAGIALSLAMISLRWRLFIRFFCRPPGFKQIFPIVSLISFASMLLPKEIVEFFGRTLWLKRKLDASFLSASSSVLADRILDIVVMTVMLFPAICFVIFHISLPLTLAIMCGGIAVGAIALFWGGEITFTFLYTCLWRASVLLARLRKKTPLDPNAFIVPSLPRKALLVAYFATLLKFLLIDFCYWTIAQSMSMEISFWVFILIVPIIQIFFLISFTAGGAGFLEAGWYLVLDTLGVDAMQIVTYLVAQRLFFTSGLMIIALLAYGLTLLSFGLRQLQKY